MPSKNSVGAERGLATVLRRGRCSRPERRPSTGRDRVNYRTGWWAWQKRRPSAAVASVGGPDYPVPALSGSGCSRQPEHANRARSYKTGVRQSARKVLTKLIAHYELGIDVDLPLGSRRCDGLQQFSHPEGEVERLPGVKSRVAGGLVVKRQLVIGQIVRSAEALGHVVTGHL